VSTSSWWYYGRLTPPGADFNVPSVSVDKHSEIVVMYDGHSITSRPGPDAVSNLADGRDLLTLVAASYAVITSKDGSKRGRQV
jgi:hypothetical protein